MADSYNAQTGTHYNPAIDGGEKSGLQTAAAGAAAGGGLIGGLGAFWAGKKQQAAYYEQASLLGNQANEVLRRAQENIGLMRQQGEKLIGAQGVAASGSGLSIEKGTSAYEMMEQSHSELTQDIFKKMREANYESNMMRAQAQQSIKAGDTARTASYWQGAGSLLSGAASAAAIMA